MVLFCYYLWLSSTLAWKIPWTEEPSRLQSMGSQRVRHDWAAHFCFSLSCIGEGNSNILQWSCLENPRDGGARWAVVYGVAESWTLLKRLKKKNVRGLAGGLIDPADFWWSCIKTFTSVPLIDTLFILFLNNHLHFHPAGMSPLILPVSSYFLLMWNP